MAISLLLLRLETKYHWQLGLSGPSGCPTLGATKYNPLWRQPWPCHHFWPSASATSVSSCVLSPMSQRLFHCVIMKSGVAKVPGLNSSSSEAISTVSSLIHTNPGHLSLSSISEPLVFCLWNGDKGSQGALGCVAFQELKRSQGSESTHLCLEGMSTFCDWKNRALGIHNGLNCIKSRMVPLTWPTEKKEKIKNLRSNSVHRAWVQWSVMTNDYMAGLCRLEKTEVWGWGQC